MMACETPNYNFNEMENPSIKKTLCYCFWDNPGGYRLPANYPSILENGYE
jgi:hypothetical protein